MRNHLGIREKPRQIFKDKPTHIRIMTNEYELYLEASTRGYHAYFKDATVYIGEILICEMEPNNRHSKYAVVVKNEDCWSCPY